MEEYKVIFFYDPSTGSVPVNEYLEKISDKERIKILKYVEFLRQHKGVLDEPYTKHIRGKIRELRVDFSRNRHRIFFFTFVGKNIILLHAFLKKTAQTPEAEIVIALEYLKKQLKNSEMKQYYDQVGKQLEIAYQIVQLRKAGRVSQKQLAKKLGTTQSNIARLEAGQQNFTTQTLEKIAHVFEKDLKIEFV